MTVRSHRRRTRTVLSYSPGCASVHPNLIHASLEVGPTRVHNPNGISIGSAVFAGFTIVADRPTDRQTGHATPSVTVGRIYVRIRCGLKKCRRTWQASVTPSLRCVTVTWVVSYIGVANMDANCTLVRSTRSLSPVTRMPRVLSIILIQLSSS